MKNYVNESDEEIIEDDSVNPYLEDREADYYDRWRDDCAMEFSSDLARVIKSYLAKENHYMNTQDHIVGCLKGTIEFIERYGVGKL